MPELSDALLEIARVIGLDIQPADKRGEVMLIFPRQGREPISLRLSRKKAVELVLWLYVNRAIKREEEEVEP